MKQKHVKLLKPHTHAGRDYDPGAVLKLDEDAADWLISIGTAEATAAPKPEAK